MKYLGWGVPTKLSAEKFRSAIAKAKMGRTELHHLVNEFYTLVVGQSRFGVMISSEMDGITHKRTGRKKILCFYDFMEERQMKTVKFTSDEWGHRQIAAFVRRQIARTNA